MGDTMRKGGRMTFYDTMPSPIGKLTLTSEGDGLTGLSMNLVQSNPDWKRDPDRFKKVKGQLERYFEGKLRRFDIPVELEGSEFQLAVWREMKNIPYGETISYGELARRIGLPKSARAVGRASGSNRIAIIIPCHRVIGTDGTLTGYGGGLDRKEKLLKLEGGFGGSRSYRSGSSPAR
jgi:methylated-DNA-[protein]-cysteine S-methyltransferase